MNSIPTPQKGSPISLNWGKAVTESCNAARAIGTGGLVRSGPFGLGEAPLPANHRDRRGGTVVDNGCWKLKRESEMIDGADEAETYTVFDNQYVMIGGILRECSFFERLEELIAVARAEAEESGETSSDGESKLFVAVRLSANGNEGGEDEDGVPIEGIKVYKSLSELRTAQHNPDHHVIPIYLLTVIQKTEEVETEDGGTTEETKTTFSVTCDFRKGLFAQQVEIIGSLSSSGGSGE